ncbi:MAG: hypothetical protein ACWA5X_00030, partial [bacterium]
LSRPETIELTENVSDLRFIGSFRATIPSSQAGLNIESASQNKEKSLFYKRKGFKLLSKGAVPE